MNENNSLLFEVINILPEVIECYIQAPSLADETILSLMELTVHAYYKSIRLGGNNKNIFLQRVKDYPIEEYFQSIEIRFEGKLLFEGYNGVDFGIISNTLKLPEWFIDKYVKGGMCNVSNEW